MIFVTAQPDELMFAWQTDVQMRNYESLGIDLSLVHILIGYNNSPQAIDTLERWQRVRSTYPTVNLHFYKDERETKRYASSIRPFLLRKFFTDNPMLIDEYMFYTDSDIALHDLPNFKAMEDYRWHVSRADYISWNYINEKHSPSMMRDMLDSVGIPESIVKEKGQDVGGVQYYIYGTTPEFWLKVEQDCERMWIKHHLTSNFNRYRKEFFDNFLKPMPQYQDVDFKEWFEFDEHYQKFKTKPEGKEHWINWDFQIWCVDMWVIYWNALLVGIDVYVNPEMAFNWPKHEYTDVDKYCIYHDAGIEQGESDKWFCKKNYKYKTPFLEDHSKKAFFDSGEPASQRFYIDIIDQISEDIRRSKEFSDSNIPMVSCLIHVENSFELLERSVSLFLMQEYPNKELVIINTGEHIELGDNLINKGIRLYNNKTKHDASREYEGIDDVRDDLIKLALGDYFIFWNTSYVYLPFHVSQGIDYILKNNTNYYPTKHYLKEGDNFNIIEKYHSVYGFIYSKGSNLYILLQLDEDIDTEPSFIRIHDEHELLEEDKPYRNLDLYSPLRINNIFKCVNQK